MNIHPVQTDFDDAKDSSLGSPSAITDIRTHLVSTPPDRSQLASNDEGLSSAACFDRSSARTKSGDTVSQFTRNLDRAVDQCSGPEDVITACAEILRQQAASFVGRYAPAGTRIGETERLEGLTAPSMGLTGHCNRK